MPPSGGGWGRNAKPKTIKNKNTSTFIKPAPLALLNFTFYILLDFGRSRAKIWKIQNDIGALWCEKDK
jgi:hypothetical protein